MENKFFYQKKFVAAYIFVAASVLVFTGGVFAQTSAKQVEATELVRQISEGKEINLEKIPTL